MRQVLLSGRGLNLKSKMRRVTAIWKMELKIMARDFFIFNNTLQLSRQTCSIEANGNQMVILSFFNIRSSPSVPSNSSMW